MTFATSGVTISLPAAGFLLYVRAMNKLFAVMLVAACGDDPVAKVDAGGQPDTPPADAAVDADTRAREGIVILAEIRGADEDVTAAAILADGPVFGTPIASGGGCDVYADPEETGFSAGNISITGTTEAITLEPSTTTPVEYRPADPLPDDLFAPGATLTVAAAGATVPAFNATVTAPALLENPVVPATISRATPPSITWTAGTADEMWIWILPLVGNGSNVIWCRAPDNGSFALTTAITALIPAQATAGFVFLWRTNTTEATAGNWTVDVTAGDVFGTDAVEFEQ